MTPFRVTRQIDVPDEIRIARARASPNLGPRLLFFSGGSALNEISRQLKLYTHNSAHLVTPFDSGGSSQVLREAFDMPAVGDLRSRLMALADETELGQPEIFALFSHRFPKTGSARALQEEFEAMRAGQHPLLQAVSQPMRSLILRQLDYFAQQRSDDFDFRNASVGNLILAGGYFQNDRALEPVLFVMSKMVAVLGTVRAVVDTNLHIGAELSDGTIIIGQRFLTGKEVRPLTQPIRRLFLCDGEVELKPGQVELPDRNRLLIERADLICYPPGSLYSSVIANLLPKGVGESIARRVVPKVYVPSMGQDPECIDMSLRDQIEALVSALRRDAGADCPVENLLNLVLVDETHTRPTEIHEIEAILGIPCLTADLAARDARDRYAPKPFCDALVSLI